ncbi:tetratricopeptide repeat protein [Rothia sp. CCM 9418]|uniref:co-chaperone YbbN n=1 Tax=Rothia sp. CCM 9418 TaxID=3402661 RepID=UPI003ADFFB97
MASSHEPFIPSSVRRAPDLSQLAQQPASAESSAPAGDTVVSYRYEVTSGEDFQKYVQMSSQGAVIFVLWSAQSAASEQTLRAVEEVVNSAGGNLLLASVDVGAHPEIAQAFQVQSVPAGVAVLAGRPAPLFNAPIDTAQATELLQQVLQIAAEHQLPGGFAPSAGEVAEKPLPPLHQEALDAIDRGDYASAQQAYQRALAENPGDKDAKLGLSQVNLLSRVSAYDTVQVRAQAAQEPLNVDAALAVADLDISGGHVEDAFNRLINVFKQVDASAQNTVRERLVELFDVVGSADPRVVKARTALMTALF